MSRVSAASSPYLIDSASLAQCVIESRPQRIRHEPKGIQEIAFAGPVRTNEKCQSAQLHVARRYALVVFDDYAAKKRGVGHVGDSGRAVFPFRL
jgi:hypothetical protein